MTVRVSTALTTPPSRAGQLFRLALSAAFIFAILLIARQIVGDIPGSGLLIVAAVIGAYMAMNIGANDVANNVGPAVGAKALSLGGAILIAAVFESMGALIAGGDVVGTIKSDIIDPSKIADAQSFVWLMTAALLAGAIWLNAATALGAPVSTTHSIVGGVLGAGVAAGGFGIANWATMGSIAASWVISPVLGGAIAAAFLYLIKKTVSYKDDPSTAARQMVPLLVAIMAWAFSTYLILKGLKKIWAVDFGAAMLIGLGIATLTFLLMRPAVARAQQRLPAGESATNALFTVPLVFAAALLSFAHGANDVANAVGPLAAINEAITHGAVASKAGIPLWVMLIGAAGIALGLALYGPRLIRTVGSEITELDQTRAFCIALAAAITVIIASQLGLPVSSTHIAVGGVFGVGFLREYLKSRYERLIAEIRAHHLGEDKAVVDAFLEAFHEASVEDKKRMLRELKERSTQPLLSKPERKQLKKAYKTEIVQRSHLHRIVAAWIITVPASALLAAMLYYMLRGLLLP